MKRLRLSVIHLDVHHGQADENRAALLAVHRLKAVEPTDRKFVFPKTNNFEKHFNQAFGVIKQETFQVEVSLTGYAAAFAKERRLSPDQKTEQKKDGVALIFTASSEPEVVSWVRGGKVLSPDWLVEKVKETAAAISGLYA